MEQLINDVKESYNQYIYKIPSGSMEIAELLREENIVKAGEVIKQFSEGISWLLEAARLLNINGVIVSFDSLKITDFLNEINEGLEIQDYNLVADLFEYEIAPFFESIEIISD